MAESRLTCSHQNHRCSGSRCIQLRTDLVSYTCTKTPNLDHATGQAYLIRAGGRAELVGFSAVVSNVLATFNVHSIASRAKDPSDGLIITTCNYFMSCLDFLATGSVKDFGTSGVIFGGAG